MGIPIVYFRSSSFNCHRFCQQQYLIEYYLGWRGPSNKKADKGTIVHKVLELTALCKKAVQDGHKVFNDEIIGEVYTDKYTSDYLDEVIDRVYEYYTKAFSHHEWTDKDLKDCRKWVWEALTYKDGVFDPRNMNIVAAEPHFDFEIKEDWAKYEYDFNGIKLQGNLSLKGTVDLVTDIGDGVYEIVDWKGLPLDTKIPTPNGFTTMGEINIGDQVFDQYGKVCNVVGKSKVKIKDCFKITFDDKTTVTCDDEHLWKLSDGSTISIQKLKVNDKINVCKSIECPAKILPIDPYVLGIWLGDGRNRNFEITSSDQFIFDEIERRGYQLGIDQENRSETLSTRIVLKSTDKLRELNLINNKHIPDIYFRASVQQRLDLLRGLMDSDGNVNKRRKQAVFTTCNKRLSDDVKHLLITLGQRPNQSLINRNTNFKDDVNIYPIAFRCIDINPFLLPRKANQIDQEWGYGNSSVRKIVAIKKSITQKTQCIAVDSLDNTYLCTENFIPTHNTGKRLDWATGEVKDQKKLFRDAQLRMYHLAAKHMFPEANTFIITIYFINDGGPWTVHFQDKDLPKTKEMIQKKFEYIKRTQRPSLLKEIDADQSWKCRKLCHAGMTSFSGTEVEPIYNNRYGREMTKCEQVRYMTEKKGVEWVIQNYHSPGFNFASYKAPGSVE